MEREDRKNQAERKEMSEHEDCCIQVYAPGARLRSRTVQTHTNATATNTIHQAMTLMKIAKTMKCEEMVVEEAF